MPNVMGMYSQGTTGGIFHDDINHARTLSHDVLGFRAYVGKSFHPW